MKQLLSICTLFLILVSCNPGNVKTLPESTGRPGELVVVINKTPWDTTPGNLIRKYFQQIHVGLPQEEPIFKVINVPHSSFSGILQRHRTVLIVDINPKIKKQEALVRKNVWADDQVIVEINAADNASAVELINTNCESFVGYIQDVEVERLQKRVAKSNETALAGQIKKDHNISISIPHGFNLATKGENFTWLKSEEQKHKERAYHQIIKGIMIYHYDYTDKEMLSKDFILAMRDSLTQAFIPGSAEGSFMKIERAYDPNYKEINLNGGFAIELRGLWALHADFMGGPFLSYTTVDQKRNRVITAEAFLYCPQFDKREYLRELEAVLKSLKFEE